MLWNISQSAQIRLFRSFAHHYHYGNFFIESNINTAIQWYQKAAELNDPLSLFDLGKIYETQDKIDQAWDHYLEASLLGHVDAYQTLSRHADHAKVNFYLGYIAEHNQDWQQAIEKYTTAANQNFSAATYQLGLLYQKDRKNIDGHVIIAQDHEKQFQQIRRAIIQGSEDAFGKLFESSHTQAKAAMHLAQMFENGEGPCQKNIDMAQEFYLSSATMGEWNAMTALISIAEEKNSLSLMHTIAELYQNIFKDFEAAIVWYKKLIALGCEKAPDTLNTMIKENFDSIYEIAADYELRDFAVSQQYYHTLLLLGFGKAAHRLGEIYEYGCYGINKNEDAAIKYYLQAVSKDYLAAILDCVRLANRLNDAEYDYQVGRVYESKLGEDKKSLIWYKKALDKNHAEVAAHLELFFDKNLEICCHLGDLYFSENDLDKALKYYLARTLPLHILTDKLKKLADLGHAASQYQFAIKCLHPQGLHEQAVEYCLLASSQLHVDALKYLSETEFSEKIYYKIGQAFDNVELTKRNMERSVFFYKKGQAQGSINSAFRLGQIYEHGDGPIPANWQEAYNGYLNASRGGHNEAFKALKNLVNESDDEIVCFTIGEISEKIYFSYKNAIPWYKKSHDKGHVESFNAINRLASKDDEIAFQAGLLYETTNMQQAVTFHLQAALKDNNNAFKRLQMLAEQGDANAQYALGKGYFYYKKDVMKDPAHTAYMKNAVNWCMQAADKSHQEAMDFILNTDFFGQTSFSIASQFEHGEKIKKNPQYALKFYHKASKSCFYMADFRLGQIYENGELGVTPDIEQAYKFYKHAARLRYRVALSELARLVQSLGNTEYEDNLSDIYLIFYTDQLNALKWALRAADKGHPESQKRVQQILSTGFEYHCHAGDLYFSTNISIAIDYYLQAAKNNYTPAVEKLISLSMDANAFAQYALGRNYYAERNDTLNAVKWCMQAAEQNHDQAQDYINNSIFSADIYYYIAQCYENGTEVEKSLNKAYSFYNKAKDLNHTEATFRLGRAYEKAELGLDENFNLAQIHYQLAAQVLHLNAIIALERLADKTSNKDAAFFLGQIYSIRQQPIEAIYWYKRAQDWHHTQAAQNIYDIAKQDPVLSYEAGQLYEDTDLDQALKYYIMHINAAQTPALNRMQALAQSGNAQAQYLLAQDYYLSVDIMKSVALLMQAVQNGHPQALSGLKQSNYNDSINLFIAQTYEIGNAQIKPVRELAIDFYRKSSAQNNIQASFRLAELLYSKDKMTLQDYHEIWICCMKASKIHFKKTFPILEQIALKLGKDKQIELAQLYKSIFSGHKKSSIWKNKSKENDEPAMAQQDARLNQLNDNATQKTYVLCAPGYHSGGSFNNLNRENAHVFEQVIGNFKPS